MLASDPHYRKYAGLAAAAGETVRDREMAYARALEKVGQEYLILAARARLGEKIDRHRVDLLTESVEEAHNLLAASRQNVRRIAEAHRRARVARIEAAARVMLADQVSA